MGTVSHKESLVRSDIRLGDEIEIISGTASFPHRHDTVPVFSFPRLEAGQAGYDPRLIWGKTIRSPPDFESPRSLREGTASFPRLEAGQAGCVPASFSPPDLRANENTARNSESDLWLTSFVQDDWNQCFFFIWNEKNFKSFHLEWKKFGRHEKKFRKFWNFWRNSKKIKGKIILRTQKSEKFRLRRAKMNEIPTKSIKITYFG